jgi:hypothetical protein
MSTYIAWKMPEEVGGPPIFGRYALVVRHDGDKTQCRMVHTEGVAYLVTDEKPWCWTDYDPDQKVWTMEELLALCTDDNAVDLTEWVYVRNPRTESNLFQLVWWLDHPESK